MKRSRWLLYNGRVHTQAGGIVADSMAVDGRRVVAVGSRLDRDPEFRGYTRVDLRGRMIAPGLVDAHTHFFYFAATMGRVKLGGLTTLDGCLDRIKGHCSGLAKKAWVVGEGYSVESFRPRIEPDRYRLDAVTGGRPAFLFSKDMHSAWVNSRALELAGITARTRDPEGGRIERYDDGTPTGVLRETAYGTVYSLCDLPTKRETDRRFEEALQWAYRHGVTGVHSFDSFDAYDYMYDRAERRRLGLRVEYYPRAEEMPRLRRRKMRYGQGNDFIRLAGIKVFADGALGSRTALCFNRYHGTDEHGIEVTSIAEIARLGRSAARLGFPLAVHAIGDRAAANVLDAFELIPPLAGGARHRIEHLQLVRRKDLSRLRRMNVVASMQPSHCLADIDMVNRYWGKRGRNTYMFKTVRRAGIDLAFGSDCPIEPLDPMAGIQAAVRRVRPGSRQVFYPEERITALDALYHFTAGCSIAAGRPHEHGFLLPGYPADFVILSHDIGQVPPTRLSEVEIETTVFDGQVVYAGSTSVF